MRNPSHQLNDEISSKGHAKLAGNAEPSSTSRAQIGPHAPRASVRRGIAAAAPLPTLQNAKYTSQLQVGRGQLRLYYIAQVTTAPPTFAITCNRPEGVPESYKRFLINQLRLTFDLKVPLHLNFRGRPGQAKRAARKRPKAR